jgi:peroxiredoxin
MNLQHEIEKFKENFIKSVPNDVLNIMNKAMEDLLSTDPAKYSLKIGDNIPAFSLPNVKGEIVRSSGLLEKGPMVVSFYRGGWCPFCNLELHALQETLPEIEKYGASLVAVSPELPDNSISTVEKHALTFEVLSDVGNNIAREFGLVFSLARELRPVYKDLGIDLPSWNGDDSYELPFPATYVVNPDGKIIHASVNPDYTRRLDPKAVVHVLEEITR